MARQKAISLLQAAGEKADLKEIYGIVIEGVQKELISNAFKSTNYSGNPASGSCEYKRFTNSKSQEYGTARTAGKGDAITAPPVTVNVDIHREIVEEVSKYDLDTFGVANLMARRAANHIDSMATELDETFFAKAAVAATAVTTSSTSATARLSAAILQLETVQNDYVRGVPRNLMRVAASPKFYEDIRDDLDSKPNPNVDTAAEEFGTYHGVRVYSCLNVPTGVDMIIMVVGAVAEPVVTYQYGEPEKIPFSNDFAVSLFFNYGVKALTAELIFKLMHVEDGTLSELDVTSVAGTTAIGDSVITIAPSTPATGNSYVYKLGSSYSSFTYDTDLSAWADEINSGDEIACGTATRITVAEVTADGKGRARGIAILAKKS